MVVRGRVQNGVVVLEEGVRLSEGEEVTVLAQSEIGAKAHSILDIPPVSLGSVVQPLEHAGRKPWSVWITQALLLLIAANGAVRALLALAGFRGVEVSSYAMMLARNAAQLTILLWPVVALQRRERHARLIASIVLIALWGILVGVTIDALREESSAPEAQDSAVWAGEVTMFTLMHAGMALLILRLCLGRAARTYLARGSARTPAPDSSPDATSPASPPS